MNKPLTIEEIVLLLEGDVSDIDDTEDEDVETVVGGVADEDNFIENVADVAATIGLPVEVHTNSGDDDDVENIPLSIRLQQQNQGELPVLGPRTRSWRFKNMQEMDVPCNITFSDPPEDDLTPLNYIQKFVDDTIIENIVHQTNLYSTQKTGKSVDTNMTEMCQFIGIHILSGVLHMPSYRMYWADSTRFAPIAESMSRDRFYKLRNYFHLNNNDNLLPREHENYDKLFKIRPFIDSLRKNFLGIEPEEFNAVDEIMIPLKAHTSIRQFIKNKPHRWGVKVFARAGASGIVYDFEIYVGKGTKVCDSGLGMSGNIVMKMVEHLPKHQNYKLFTDNWFTSFNLAVELKKNGIFLVGTVRRNRLAGCTLKTDASLKSSGRGSFDYRVETTENIMLLKWLDNKSVHLISSYKSHEPVENVKRWSVATKQHIQVPRPAMVKEYNSFMGGVDLHDMLVQLYRTNMKGRRFYLRIVFHFINMACVNAWLLYRRHCDQQKKKHRPLVEFVCDIAAGFLRKGTRETRKRGRPSSDSPKPGPSKRKPKAARPVDDVRYDGIEHWPEYLADKSRCKLCIKSYSRTKCSKCNVALCLNKGKNCFKAFHVK